ncbi:hypothetical protein L6452_09658 [Arctium lappa]|uniref:Uncharacterized protein n=1 Tax=Arctium lappa TaxID=4217 RepID=A0ACB9DLN3_ARCLA|nr:hypothetical protein L6452_09658 [Arctium lappa]
MPYPDDDPVDSSNNRLIKEELDYDIPNLHNEFRQLLGTLTNEQRGVYDDIITAVQNNQGGVFFVYGYGGTGKTFLWKTLSASIRSRGEIVLNVASSGISSLLLIGVLRLTKNMRLTVDSQASDIEQTRIFANWLLDLGEGKVGSVNDGEAIIDIPDDLLITDSIDPISALIEFVYPSIIVNVKNSSYFQERAILAPKHKVVQEINDRLLSLFPGDENEYLSSKSVCESEHLHEQFDETLYSPDVLNGLKLSGLPNHKIVLKVGVPLMLLRNIDQKFGLCNGTRLQVLSLGNRVIEAEIISGSNIGSRTFIPRMSLTPTDKRISFKFQRRQFPIGLYVALSRVKSRQYLKILIIDDEGIISNRTKNVVYKEVFGMINWHDEAKQDFQEVVEFLKTLEKFSAVGARIPKGVLLVF